MTTSQWHTIALPVTCGNWQRKCIPFLCKKSFSINKSHRTDDALKAISYEECANRFFAYPHWRSIYLNVNIRLEFKINVCFWGSQMEWSPKIVLLRKDSCMNFTHEAYLKISTDIWRTILKSFSKPLRTIGRMVRTKRTYPLFGLSRGGILHKMWR